MLKHASDVLRSEESRAAYCQQQRLKPARPSVLMPLAIAAPIRPRFTTDESGSRERGTDGQPAFGFASAKGKRSTQEDELVLRVPIANGCFAFGVFDGHGGARAAKFASRHLQQTLSRAAAAAASAEIEISTDMLLPEEACVKAFGELEERILERARCDQWERGNDDGSCALVALVAPAKASPGAARVQFLQLGDCNGLLLRPSLGSQPCVGLGAQIGGGGGVGDGGGEGEGGGGDCGDAGDGDGVGGGGNESISNISNDGENSALPTAVPAAAQEEAVPQAAPASSAETPASSAEASAPAPAAVLSDGVSLAPFRTDGPLLCPAHRPTEPAEAARLRSAGVEVSATGRLSGLAVSRCFGDRLLKEARPRALLAVPEVRMVDMDGGAGERGSSAVLILACDGLWDWMSPQDACATVNNALAGDARHAQDAGRADGDVGGATPWWAEPRLLECAARALVDTALDKGSHDNVSVVVVAL